MRTLMMLFFLMVFGLSLAIAGEVTVPNIFEAQKKTEGEEVNQNFEAVEEAINDNAQDISNLSIGNGVTLKDGNGIIVGKFIQYFSPPITFMALSDKGYLFNVQGNGKIGYGNRDNPSFNRVYYESNNCSAQAYIDATDILTFTNGYLGAVADSSLYYYPPNSMPLQQLDTGSSFQIFDDAIGPECRAYTDYPSSMSPVIVEPVEIFSNDPVITGVPNVYFQSPVFLE